MKTKSFYLALILLSFITWSCTTNNDVVQGSLKSSISQNVQELTTALDAISSSAGYQVLVAPSTTNGPSMVKSSSDATVTTPIDSILLSDITGVYNYKATPYKRWSMNLMRYFTKTADNTQMIVSLPESKVKNPKVLLHYSPADTLLANDYVITLSDYQYRFNRYLWDYKMASNINIKNVNAGDLKIQSSYNKQGGYHFSSQFAFATGSVAKCDYLTGDTTVTTYAITDGTKTLYEEKYTSVKTVQEKKHREKSYSLTIGNVQIIRNQGPNSLDSAKVYVAGVLQLKSKVEIVDIVADSAEISVTNHKRELKITFDDGTSSTISQLLGTSVVTIRDLFASLRQSYFATSVVDWIAWDVYTNKQ